MHKIQEKGRKESGPRIRASRTDGPRRFRSEKSALNLSAIGWLESRSFSHRNLSISGDTWNSRLGDMFTKEEEEEATLLAESREYRGRLLEDRQRKRRRHAMVGRKGNRRFRSNAQWIFRWFCERVGAKLHPAFSHPQLHAF